MFCVAIVRSLPHPLEVDQRLVSRARCRGPRRVVQPLLPRVSADLRVGQIRVDVDQAHRRGVRRPHAVRTAVVGDARVRAETGAGEHRDGVGRLHQGGNETNLVCHAVIVQGCADTNTCSCLRQPLP